MVGNVDIQEKDIGSTGSLPESNFDKLQKTYPNQKDKINFLNNTKFADIKEQLSKTINELAKDNTISQEDFRNNIQNTTETLFSDQLFDFDAIAKANQAENIFLFREELKNIKTKKEKENEQTNTKTTENTKEKVKELNTELREKLESKYSMVEKKHKHKEPKDLEDLRQDPKIQENLKKIPSEKQQDLYLSYLYATNKIIEEAKKPENKNKLTKVNYDFIEHFNTLNEDLGITNEIDLTEFTNDKEEYKPEEGNTTGPINDIVYDKDLGKNLAENNDDVEEFIADKSSDFIKLPEKDEEEEDKSLLSKKSLEDKIGDWYPDEIKEDIMKLLKKNKIGKDNEAIYEEAFNENGTVKDPLPGELKENETKLAEISKTVVNTYTSKAQKEMVPISNEVIKSKAVAALIQNIGKFLNVKDVEKQFIVDIANGIEFDKNTLTLSGTMEGKEMAFYYDMNTGSVQADDFVHYNKDDRTFYINDKDKTKGREQLPIYNMPTLKETIVESQTTFTAEIENFIKPNNNNKIENFKKELNDVSFSVNQESAVAEIAIQHAMAKNIAIQETQDFLEDYIPTKNKYSKDKEMREYSLYTMIDTSFDRYTTNEIKQRRNLLERFTNKMSEENPTFKDEMIQGIFDEDTVEKDTNGKYDTNTGPSMYKFLRALTYEQPGTTKNDVIDISFFEQIVTELESNDGDTKKLKDKSSKYTSLQTDRENAQEQLSADTIDFDKAYETPNT